MSIFLKGFSNEDLNLLKLIVSSQLEGFSDKRGFLCEHDDYGKKEFTSSSVHTIFFTGMVDLHPESEYFNGLETFGSAFLSIKESFLLDLKSHFSL